MKNVIIYSQQELFNSKTAAGNRMTKYAKALALMDCKVYITSIHHSLEKSIVHEFSRNCYYLGNIDRDKQTMFSYIYRLKKIIDRLSGETVLLLYPYNNILFEVLCFVFFKILCKKSICVEVNERRIHYYDLYGINMGLLIFIKYKILRLSVLISEYTMKYYDGLIFISKNIENLYRKKYSIKNFIRIPILCETVNVLPFTYLYDDSKSFEIAFSGQININKENIDLLFYALGVLLKEGYRIRINMYGPITDEKKIHLLIENNNLSDVVRLCGDLKYEEVMINLQKSHLLVVIRGNTMQNFYGFSTKLSDYLSTGVPVLVTDVSDVSEYLKDNVNAFVINPDSSAEIIKKIRYIINNYNQKAGYISKNAFRVVNNKFAYILYKEKIDGLFFEKKRNI